MEVARLEGHVPHGLDERAGVEGLDVDVLDGRLEEVSLGASHVPLVVRALVVGRRRLGSRATAV